MRRAHARQVVRLARQVAGPMPLRVAVCTSEFPMATQRTKLGGGVELCVATLGRLQARVRRSVGWRGAAGGGGRGVAGVGRGQWGGEGSRTWHGWRGWSGWRVQVLRSGCGWRRRLPWAATSQCLPHAYRARTLISRRRTHLNLRATHPLASTRQAHLRGPKPSFALDDNLLSLVVDEADSVFADRALRERLATLRASLSEF